MRNITAAFLLLLALPGCAAVMVGGLIFDHTEMREECQALMADPAFAEKMQIPEYVKNYERVCDVDGTAEEEAES